jgi:hypothetical protein
MKGWKQIFFAGLETLFRRLAVYLGRGCNAVADWCGERAR